LTGNYWPTKNLSRRLGTKDSSVALLPQNDKSPENVILRRPNHTVCLAVGTHYPADEESLPTGLIPKILRSLCSLRMTNPPEHVILRRPTIPSVSLALIIRPTKNLFPLAGLIPKILQSLRSLRMTNSLKQKKCIKIIALQGFYFFFILFYKYPLFLKSKPVCILFIAPSRSRPGF
jgi:hypothetical protein